MYKQYYDEFFKKCLHELKRSKHPQIQKRISQLQKDFKEDDFDEVIRPFINVIANEIIPYADEEEMDHAIADEFEEFIKCVKYARRTYIFNVQLIGQEENCWRTLQILATCQLSQLCYAIMSSFHCEGEHLFSIKYKKDTYDCGPYDLESDEDSEYAFEVILPELNLRKGSHMVLTYDFGDNYMFDITVSEVKNYHRRVTSDDIMIIDGKGYGIWEDAHYELELYYNDNQEFERYIDENGLEKDWYPIDEEFDIDELNENIIENIRFFTKIYENPEELYEKF